MTNWGINKTLILIDEQEASSSASLDFTSLLESIFDEWVLEILNMVPASDATLCIRVSTDGGSSFDSGSNYGYSCHVSAPAYQTTTGGDSGQSYISVCTTIESTRGEGYCGSIRLFNLNSSSIYKVVTFLGIAPGGDGHLYGAKGGGNYLSTSAVDAFQLLMSTGNIASGTARLFGIKNN